MENNIFTQSNQILHYIVQSYNFKHVYADMQLAIYVPVFYHNYNESWKAPMLTRYFVNVNTNSGKI